MEEAIALKADERRHGDPVLGVDVRGCNSFCGGSRWTLEIGPFAACGFAPLARRTVRNRKRRFSVSQDRATIKRYTRCKAGRSLPMACGTQQVPQLCEAIRCFNVRVV